MLMSFLLNTGNDLFVRVGLKLPITSFLVNSGQLFFQLCLSQRQKGVPGISQDDAQRSLPGGRQQSGDFFLKTFLLNCEWKAFISLISRWMPSFSWSSILAGLGLVWLRETTLTAAAERPYLLMR